MTDVENRLCRLEQLVHANDALMAALQTAMTQMQQFARTVQPGGYGGGGQSSVYTIAPVVIAAGGNVTSQTVSVLMGGSSTALPGTYTVYNVMDTATVATSGKKIIVGLNPDGTYTAITQSC